MIGCRYVRERLSAYALGDLDRRDEQQIDGHLANCPQCAEEAIRARSEVSKISDLLSTDLMAPSGLMDSVQNAIAEPKRRPRLSWRLAPVALAVACALWFATVRLNGRPGATTLELDNLLAHQELFQPHQPHMIDQGIDVHPVNIQLPEAKFVGCENCPLATGSARVFCYRIADQPISAIELPLETVKLEDQDRRIVDGKELYCCTHGGKSIVAARRGDKVILLLSPMDGNRLAGLAASLTRS